MEPGVIEKRLKWAILLTSLALVIEIIGGTLANSLALLSDAAHMFTDVMALSLSFFALKIAGKPSTDTKTFGYHRVEIFAAFLNGILLLLMACGILYEAWQRALDPHAVDSQVLIIAASIGLAVNLCVLYFLREPASHNHDLNIKSAFYHVVGDSVASIGVIAGGTVMLYTQWYIVDTFIAVAIAIFLIWVAKKIMRSALHILLEAVPEGVSIQEVKLALTAIPAIKDIHELHIWCICSNIFALSAHALVNDQKVNQVESVLGEIKETLKTRFNIDHSTIQFETNLCGDSELVCDMKH